MKHAGNYPKRNIAEAFQSRNKTSTEPKLFLRSQVSDFDFLRDCLFCGEKSSC